MGPGHACRHLEGAFTAVAGHWGAPGETKRYAERAMRRAVNPEPYWMERSSSRQGGALQERQLRRRLAGTAGVAGEETPSSEAPRKLRGSDTHCRYLKAAAPEDSRRSSPTGCGLRGAGVCVPTVCLQLLHPCPECGSSIQQFTSPPFGDDRLSCRGTEKRFCPATTAASYRSLPVGRPPSRTRMIDPQDCDAGSWTTPGEEGQFLVARPTSFHLYQSSAGFGSRTTRLRITPVAGELVH
ncbi:hypothetical protein NDU88_002172 [Pleurodeles waltl]|uniref:Uncharacterized protein n=1 Tax=Pleurodeles waltl TaxID=8319 RepID=A0AAV7P7J8_PLEWA|nr:hypothetical protein NDU88_002172 [Pleurodeles waltl]